MGKTKGFEFSKLFGECLRIWKQHGIKLFLLLMTFYIPLALVNSLLWNNVPLIQKIVFNTSLLYLDIIILTTDIMMILYFLLFSIVLVRYIIDLEEGVPRQFGAYYFKALFTLKGFSQAVLVYLYKVLLGLIRFIIPGFLAIIHYSLAPFMCIVKESYDKKAFDLSKDIIKNNLHKYLDYNLYTLIILFVLAFPAVISLDVPIFYQVQDENYFFVSMLDNISYLIKLLAFMFFLSFYYVLYRSLKEKTV